MEKTSDYSPAFIGEDIDGESAYLQENLPVLDRLNQGQVFKIVEKGRRFYLEHGGEKEQLTLSLRSMEQAVELRSFLEKKDVKNQSCLQRAQLNECLLRELGYEAKDWKFQNKHDIYRTEDVKNINFFSTPFLYQEELPGFLRGEHAPSDTVKIIMDYMNRVMKSTVSTVKK